MEGRPVDVSSLKGEVKQWRLSSDMSLQSYLSEFSQSVADKTKALVGKIDDLGNDVSEADVRLRNTFCEFIMLANSQFIENVSPPLSQVLPSIRISPALTNPPSNNSRESTTMMTMVMKRPRKKKPPSLARTSPRCFGAHLAAA